MKILTFKRLIGLTAIGGVAYIHKQRGGVWTVASVADTLKHLWSSMLGQLDHPRNTAERATNLTEAAAHNSTDDVNKPRPYSDYNKRKDDTSRH